MLYGTVGRTVSTRWWEQVLVLH